MSYLDSLARLEGVLSVMDRALRTQTFEDIQTQKAIDRQLESDLQRHLGGDYTNGVQDSLFYRMLPVEVRYQIYSYLVTVPDPVKSVHVFPPKGNEAYGFRLSLCEESAYSWQHGHCRCDNGRSSFSYRPSVQSAFFDSAIFLVSRLVRREALDAFFGCNSFTFTSIYELVRFTSTFKTSSGKIRHLRILERVDDYPASEMRIKNVQKARERLCSLSTLSLHIYITPLSAYETIYDDGLINEVIHLAFASPDSLSSRRTNLQNFEVNARARSFGIASNETDQLTEVARRIEKKLVDIFMSGKYSSAADVPMAPKPQEKIREDQMPLDSKKGIIFLKD